MQPRPVLVDAVVTTGATQDLLAQGEVALARIQSPPLHKLEALAVALLDFSGPDDLSLWLSQHGI